MVQQSRRQRLLEALRVATERAIEERRRRAGIVATPRPVPAELGVLRRLLAGTFPGALLPPSGLEPLDIPRRLSEQATGAIAAGIGGLSQIPSERERLGREEAISRGELLPTLEAAAFAFPPGAVAMGGLGALRGELAGAGRLAERGVRRGVARGLAAAGKPAAATRVAFGRPAAAVRGAEGTFEDLVSLDEQIAAVEKRIKPLARRPNLAAQQEAAGEREYLISLRGARQSLMESQLSPEDLARYREMQQDLFEAEETLKAIIETKPTPAPRFGTRERAEWEARRRELGVKPGATAAKKARLRGQIEEFKRDIADIEAGKTLPQPITQPPQQIGAVQAGMGIGERPPQGGLFEGFRGEAERMPLADAEQLAARQARAAEVARGQAELPLTEPVASAGTARLEAGGWTIKVEPQKLRAAGVVDTQATFPKTKEVVFAGEIELTRPSSFNHEMGHVNLHLMPPQERGRMLTTFARDVLGMSPEASAGAPRGVIESYADAHSRFILREPELYKGERAFFAKYPPLEVDVPTLTAPAAKPITPSVAQPAPGAVSAAKPEARIPSARPFFDRNSTVNEGRRRLRDPDEFIPGAFVSATGKKSTFLSRNSTTPGVRYLVGKLKTTGKEAYQTVRFNKQVMPEAKAAQWWEANKGRLGVTAAEPPPVAAAQPGVTAARVPPPAEAQAQVGAQVPAPSAGAAGVTPPSPGGPPPPAGRPPRRPLWADIPEEPPRQPPGEIPTPDVLPSGRRPGGPARMKPSPLVDDYARLRSALEPEQTPFINKLEGALDSFMTNFIDRNHALWKLQKETGIPVHDLTQVVPGSTAAGEFLVGQLMRPIYRALGRDTRFLEEYMVLKRMEDILALNPSAQLPGKVRGAAGIQQAMRTIQKKVSPEQFAAIEEAARQLWQINDEQVLKVLVREGIITPDARRAMLADHPHYIPFKRADFTEDIARGGRSEASLSTTGIQRIGLGGSGRALADPLLRLEAQLIRTQQIIARNRAAKGLADSLMELQAKTGEDLIRFIEPKGTMRAAERVTGQALPRAAKGESSKLWEPISYFKDGEQVTANVPAVFGRVAKGLDSAEAGGMYATLLRVLSAPLRHGAVTYNPAFLLVNALRDATSAFWREKLIPLSPEYWQGWIAVVKRNATYEEAARSGALLSGLTESMRTTKALTRAAVSRGALSVKSLADALLVIPRLIERANVATEQATRVATFAKLRAQGLEPLAAAVRSRNATVDFAKMGTSFRMINNFYPFANASLQGTLNTLAVIKNNPKWAAVAATPFIAATAIARINNMRFKTSAMIPDYEYTNSWVLQIGEGKDAEGQDFPVYIKIPKGQIASIITFPGEALFNLARDQEDRSAAELLLDAGFEALRAVSPVDPGLGGLVPIPAMQTMAGLATGVDLWRRQPIVPRREEGLLPEQQFGPQNTRLAIELGKRFKISPRMIDFAIQDYTAGAGEASSWLLGAFMDIIGRPTELFGEAVPKEQPTTALQRISGVPIVRRFLGTRGTQLERRGWERYDQVVEETARAFNDISEMNALGIRLGVVSGTIGEMELTPAQRADYQQAMAAVVIPGVQEYIRSLPTATAPTVRRELIQRSMASLKEKARSQFVLASGTAPMKKMEIYANTLPLMLRDSPTLLNVWETYRQLEDGSIEQELFRQLNGKTLIALEKLQSTLRTRMRLTDPELDKLVSERYGSKPLHPVNLGIRRRELVEALSR